MKKHNKRWHRDKFSAMLQTCSCNGRYVFIGRFIKVMKGIYWSVVAIFFSFVSLSVKASDDLVFLCSWDNRKPINIVANIRDGTATRSDGGKNYTIVKLSERALWLAIDDPENMSALKLQMIQRGDAVESGKGGMWVDVVFAISGNISPIDGGTCWEQT